MGREDRRHLAQRGLFQLRPADVYGHRVVQRDGVEPAHARDLFDEVDLAREVGAMRGDGAEEDVRRAAEWAGCDRKCIEYVGDVAGRELNTHDLVHAPRTHAHLREWWGGARGGEARLNVATCDELDKGREAVRRGVERAGIDEALEAMARIGADDVPSRGAAHGVGGADNGGLLPYHLRLFR